MKFLFCIPSLVLQDEKQCRIELRVWKSLIQINNLRYNRFNIFYSRGAFCLKALEVFLYGAQSSIFGVQWIFDKKQLLGALATLYILAPPATTWSLRLLHSCLVATASAHMKPFTLGDILQIAQVSFTYKYRFIMYLVFSRLQSLQSQPFPIFIRFRDRYFCITAE